MDTTAESRSDADESVTTGAPGAQAHVPGEESSATAAGGTIPGGSAVSRAGADAVTPADDDAAGGSDSLADDEVDGASERAEADAHIPNALGTDDNP